MVTYDDRSAAEHEPRWGSPGDKVPCACADPAGRGTGVGGWPGRPAARYPAGRPALVTSERKQQPRRAAAAAPIQQRAAGACRAARLPPRLPVVRSSPPPGGPALESLRRGRAGSGAQGRGGRARTCQQWRHVQLRDLKRARARPTGRGPARDRCRRISAGGRPVGHAGMHASLRSAWRWSLPADCRVRGCVQRIDKAGLMIQQR